MESPTLFPVYLRARFHVIHSGPRNQRSLFYNILVGRKGLDAQGASAIEEHEAPFSFQPSSQPIQFSLIHIYLTTFKFSEIAPGLILEEEKLHVLMFTVSAVGQT
jgi:hypothetical protein